MEATSNEARKCPLYPGLIDPEIKFFVMRQTEMKATSNEAISRTVRLLRIVNRQLQCDYTI